MERETTALAVSPETRARLRDLGEPDQTDEAILDELLETFECMDPESRRRWPQNDYY